MRVKLYEREDREETLRYITQNWLYNLKRTIEEEESKRGRMPFVSLSLSSRKWWGDFPWDRDTTRKVVRIS